VTQAPRLPVVTLVVVVTSLVVTSILFVIIVLLDWIILIPLCKLLWIPHNPFHKFPTIPFNRDGILAEETAIFRLHCAIFIV